MNATEVFIEFICGRVYCMFTAVYLPVSMDVIYDKISFAAVVQPRKMINLSI